MSMKGVLIYLTYLTDDNFEARPIKKILPFADQDKILSLVTRTVLLPERCPAVLSPPEWWRDPLEGRPSAQRRGHCTERLPSRPHITALMKRPLPAASARPTSRQQPGPSPGRRRRPRPGRLASSALRAAASVPFPARPTRPPADRPLLGGAAAPRQGRANGQRPRLPPPPPARGAR